MIRLGVLVLLSAAAALALAGASSAGRAEPGTTTEQANALQSALDTAIDDERHAVAFYKAVMKTHGERRPFINIIRAERRHEAALLQQYDRLGLTAPENRWLDHVFHVPASFADACDLSAVAEVRNVKIYEDLMASVEDARVQSVFDSLRRASAERHLPAFRRHGNGWQRLAADTLSGTQERQQDLALQAQRSMFSALFTELTDALEQGGAVNAIRVCATRAPVIAAEQGTEHGVRIGRTSWKLRNPDNTPPVWAELAVDERPHKPVSFADQNGRFGTLRPIQLAASCLQCHGSPADLAPGVADALADGYPQDMATGFAEGDLRGWFWVEVPAMADRE